MIFADNQYRKLTAVAKEINIDTEEALLYIASHQCSAITMLAGNIIKKINQHNLVDIDNNETTFEDVNHSLWYVPANPQVINDIRLHGKYSTSYHTVTYPYEKGTTEEIYIPYTPGAKADHKIEATIDSLYISGHHAEVLKQHVRAQRAMDNKKDKEILIAIDENSTSTKSTSNQPADDKIHWKWPKMKNFTGLDRKTIINRAERLGIEILNEDGHRGLRESDLRRIINDK